MAVLRNLFAIAGAIAFGNVAGLASMAFLLSYTDAQGEVEAFGTMIIAGFVGIEAFVGSLIALLLVANRKADAGVIVGILVAGVLIAEHIWVLSG